MKSQRFSRGIALLFVKLGTRWRWVVNSTPRTALTILQEPRWAPGPVWTGAENLAPTGIFFPFPFSPLIHFVLLNPSALLHATYVPYYCPYTTNTTQIFMPSAGFEPAIPASVRQQTHAGHWDRLVRSPDRPARIESLYILSYPGPPK